MTLHFRLSEMKERCPGGGEEVPAPPLLWGICLLGWGHSYPLTNTERHSPGGHMEAQRSHRLACRHSANKWWRVDLPPDVPSVRDGLGAPLRSLHLEGAPSPHLP